MTNSRSTRMRMVAAAGSLALAVSLVSAPVAFAQDDDPVDTLNGLLEAIEAKDFESLPTFFCEEFAADMGGLDLASMAEGLPPGMDVDTLLDAFIFDVELESAEVLSQTDTEAIVDMTGSMSMEINVDALMPFIEGLLASLGEEVTPDMVQMFTGLMLAEIPTESTDISSEITLVRGETMPWVVCSDLSVGSDMDEAAGADATPAASDGE
jgi:hypothetical protein